MFFLDPWLGLTQGQPVAVRCAVAVVTIAPLASAMGHMFPIGIRQIGEAAPALVPWAWAVNGCASVLSSILAVMIAISQGFSRVLIAGGLAYALALIAIYTLAAGESEPDRSAVGDRS